MKHHLPFESPSQCAAGKVGSKLSSVGATFPVHHHKNVMNGGGGGMGGPVRLRQGGNGQGMRPQVQWKLHSSNGLPTL